MLIRLSVRSLHQYKCVSKLWNTLISDPYFKMMHFKHAKNNRNSQRFLITHLCRNERRFDSYYCSISLVQMVEDALKLDCPLGSKPLLRVMCSCDGFVVAIVSADMMDKHPIHLLWNPSIRESIVLPAPQSETCGYTRYGFGYDSTSGDYKILRICSNEYTETLALKGGSWRKIDEHPRGVSSELAYTSYLAFVHEAFHWIGSLIDFTSQYVYIWTRMDSLKKFSLVSFSISKEVYGEIPLPEQILSLVDIKYLGVIVLDGMLSVYSVTSDQHQDLQTLKLWVLKDYDVKESWTALFTVEDPSVYRVVPKYRFADGELLFRCFHKPSRGNVFRTSVGPFMSWLPPSIQDIVVFTESFISPKSLVSYV
ncbi:F-box protein CPR1-like isoform X2 [Solanum pennellii]|uniref:F-box protein CPR1-like isoform X2 n=1 Tax=Solanum pennellii TaxID=28526 RepID=A0ABM1FIQ2_SOLPN|nr:F-box protein CPR1-like isoform X2 [Solanum pennellii]